MASLEELILLRLLEARLLWVELMTALFCSELLDSTSGAVLEAEVLLDEDSVPEQALSSSTEANPKRYEVRLRCLNM